MATRSPLYVLLATHERPDLLRRTLESLAECEQPDTYEATIVVENGSKGGTREVVHAFGDMLNAQYLYTPHDNKSHALNYALQEIPNGLIYFTDDDVRFRPSVLVSYVKAAKQEGRGAFFGGPTSVDYEESPPEWLVSSLPASARGWGEDGFEEESFQWFLGFNWAAFRSDVVSQGGFDPRFGPGSPTGATGQETEMQRRLADSGLRKVFVSDAKVTHYVPKSRCNARWLLRRSYRQGCAGGIHLEEGDVTMFGIPGFVYRTLQVLMKMLFSALRGGRADWFGELRSIYSHAGHVVGYISKNKN
jgi:GT2 family glycosyltransferase